MLKVLVVEDEPYVRRGIVLAVDWASLGCVVAGEASNGREGLEEAMRIRPDIIVTDIKMPQMDGLEMLRLLRERGIDSAVIILTAYGEFSYAQQALRLGATDYLVKPFHDGELERIVENIRARGETADALPAQLTALTSAQGKKSKYVSETVAFIAANYSQQNISVGSIAESLHISEGYLSHVFKRETGATIVEYLAQYRVLMATRLLKDCRKKVYEVAEAVGYRDIAYFSATFRKLMGLTPSEYQNSAGDGGEK